MPARSYERQVFLNCPFDPEFQAIRDAITFAVFDCGFRPRSAMEVEDASQVRIDKIFDIIRDCKFGIHDISQTEADVQSGLPRFNMPLELGMFLGAKRYGQDRQKRKMCLILDRERHRYQAFISDIAGQDLRSHQGQPLQAIGIVRDWLRSVRPQVSIPGGRAVAGRYERFSQDLPAMCAQLRLAQEDLTYIDYTWCVSEWLKTNSA
ncbi:MAG TPA: hypothetical protein VOA80_12585 [Thermoanaerobaculia bacterium]|nr:hypothetical protein [Thermoanaerobaculia bacterium]